MPTPVGFRQWRTAVWEAVAAACGTPQAAFAWVQHVEKKGVTCELLHDLAGWPTLDAKLAAALAKIITGEFTKQVVALKETAAAQGKLLKGRQLFLKHYEYFGLYESEDRAFNMEYLLPLQLQGDDLRSFLSQWDAILANRFPQPKR